MSRIAGAAPQALPTTDTRAKRPLRRFLLGARGYWISGPRLAWPLTLGLLAVVIASLGITYSINLWNRYFFDALEAKNAASAAHQALLFPVLIGLYLALCVFAMWARMTMQRTWRAWLNAQLLHRWLTKARFYKLELIGGDHKNPEHRINDDLRIATEMPVDFVTGFVTALLSAATFLAVLWSVGGALHIALGRVALTIPGFLVVAAFIYALVVNGSMLAIAFRFIPITEKKNQAEAEYRYALTRVRENAESIALLDGGAAEEARLNRSFGGVVARWRDLMVQHMRAVIVAQGSAQFAGVVPVLLCTPLYLNGRMSLGAVMQVASAFVIVQSALSWFMENYTRLADWTASARRVAGLMAALDTAERSEAFGGISRGKEEAPGLQFRKTRVTLDGGRPIVAAVNVAIEPGERVLIAGESGSGKSSLLRALAGCWPWGGGEIVHGSEQRILVVPQRAYLPAGTLREALIYLGEIDEVSADRAEQALAAVGLGVLRAQLDTQAAWANILSEGEKQRLAIARVLLHRPDIVALDEATSALDVTAQTELMELLARALPRAIIISVGHRPELENFHARKLVIARGPDGARIVWDGRIVKPAARIISVFDQTQIGDDGDYAQKGVGGILSMGSAAAPGLVEVAVSERSPDAVQRSVRF